MADSIDEKSGPPSLNTDHDKYRKDSQAEHLEKRDESARGIFDFDLNVLLLPGLRRLRSVQVDQGVPLRVPQEQDSHRQQDTLF